MHLPWIRGIQLSSSNMCGDTVEFCMRMHFGRDFLGRARGGGGVFPSVSSVAIVRNSAARLTPRNYILRTSSTGSFPSFPFRLSSIIRCGCHLLKFKTSLSWNVCYDSRIESRCNFQRKIPNGGITPVCEFAFSVQKISHYTEILMSYILLQWGKIVALTFQI